MNKISVYDIESYPDIFYVLFRSVGSKKVYKDFEISSRKNQLRELIQYLEYCRDNDIILVGYNNSEFDYPLLHFILTKGKVTLYDIFRETERIINADFSRIPDWNIIVKQIDLLKIHHFDNANRWTSLKWLEFMLRWHKVQDLPFPPGIEIGEGNFDILIDYCYNDVDFTYFFLGHSLDAINFRHQMSRILAHNVMNYSDVKIGEHINKKTYAKLSRREWRDFKDERSPRSVFKVSQLLPDFTSFKTDELKKFYNTLKGITFTAEKDFEVNPRLGNLTVNFKKGGLHSQDASKIVTCKPDHYLKEVDVGSMYPKALIEGGLYPEHLGPSWLKGIQSLYEERIHELKPKIKKLFMDGKKNSAEFKFLDSKQQAYKLAMNGGGYGKTGQSFSWQYDPLVMLRVTFRGQISLMMLIEMYYLNNITVISANTDGIVIHYHKDLDSKVEQIKQEWEEITKFELEDTYYSRIIFSNVNNYIAEIIDRDTKKRIKLKFKGKAFLIDPEPHQNNSQRIVAIAVAEYFLRDVPVEDVVRNVGYAFINSKDKKEHTTIFDYCIGRKKGSNTECYVMVSPDGNTKYTDKVMRFYVANTNKTLIKVYDSGKTEAVNRNFNHEMFMEYKEAEDYNINFNYYISECYKIINKISKAEYVEQLTLF